MQAHVITIDTDPATVTEDGVVDAHPRGQRYRWRCSCRKRGGWSASEIDDRRIATAARRARNGGARHVAAMERGR